MQYKQTEKLLAVKLSSNKNVRFDKKQVLRLNKNYSHCRNLLIFNTFDQKTDKKR